jgi:hypothetical protein
MARACTTKVPSAAWIQERIFSFLAGSPPPNSLFSGSYFSRRYLFCCQIWYFEGGNSGERYSVMAPDSIKVKFPSFKTGALPRGLFESSLKLAGALLFSRG